jgi:type IV secretion system protein VirD4
MISAVLFVFVFLIAYAARAKESGVQYIPDVGTHGTAGFMTAEEMKKVLNVGSWSGIIFGEFNGKVLSLPPGAYFNRHVAVFGASGSMKSRAYVRTNILQMSKEGHSMILTDPKGELARDTAKYLEEMGYTVRVFNLVNMTRSDRWNPISEVTSDVDAQTFAEVVIANTKIPGTKGSDPFWDRAEQNLLKALVLYVVNEYPENERNLASVYAVLAKSDRKQIDSLFSKLPYDHPAKMPYNIYAQANDTVRTGVVIGLGTRLQVFQNQLVGELTSTSDIDLVLPAKEKCAYFAVFPDTDSTFDFLAGLFFSFLFIKLMRYADLNGGTGEKQVYFLLDEFPNIGAIPDFTKKISTMRSRGLHCSIIFQNIAQLKNRYPNDAWQEIIGNCDSRLFLGATDVMTAEFVSSLLGKSTVRTINTRKKAGMAGIFDFGDISFGTSSRNLFNTDEILRLPHDSAILILRGQKPLIVKKLDYTKHPLSRRLKPEPITEREWAKAATVPSTTAIRSKETETTKNKESDMLKEPVDATDGDDFW